MVDALKTMDDGVWLTLLVGGVVMVGVGLFTSFWPTFVAGVLALGVAMVSDCMDDVRWNRGQSSEGAESGG